MDILSDIPHRMGLEMGWHQVGDKTYLANIYLINTLSPSVIL